MSATVLEMGAKRNQGQATLAAGLNEAALLAEDEALYEVEYGCVVEKPMGVLSTIFANELFRVMDRALGAQRAGWLVQECLFILDAERNLRRRPDVAFVSAQRWPLDKPLPAAGDWPVVPDLVVEVVSRGESAERLLRKIAEYFRYGAHMVWVMFPNLRQVYVYSSPDQVRVVGESAELDGGEVLPGFRLKLGELFAAVPVEQVPPQPRASEPAA
ncbi:hypothetical protein HRbin36_01068 [bacterium HR36]|nr:hypothetical protein HRbin36_01068 [bacterium HR36]